MKICNEPFENLEINTLGDAYFCCAHHIDKKSIGNIFKTTFEDVWNSKQAVDCRTRVLKNNYSLCNSSACYNLSTPDVNFVKKAEQMKPVMEKFPLRIKLMHDNECNANCIICREHIIRRSDEELEDLNSKIETIFLPLLKDAQVVVLNAAGDPFGSRHNRKLIKKITETYPNIKFELHTNGILASKEMLDDLGLTGKIYKAVVSIHASTKETYDKIVLNGNFDKTMKNTAYFAELFHKKEVFGVDMCFVVNSLNYHEMPDFLKIAKSLGVQAFFWEYRQQGCYIDEHYEDLAIHLKSHKDHDKLIEVLSNEIFDSVDNNPLHPTLNNLRKSQSTAEL